MGNSSSRSCTFGEGERFQKKKKKKNFFRKRTKSEESTLFTDSAILHDDFDENLAQIQSWFNNAQMQQQLRSTHLLYRGSRDGFRASNFHEKCDNQGPTITFVKVAGGLFSSTYICGGFTVIPWTTGDNTTDTSTTTTTNTSSSSSSSSSSSTSLGMYRRSSSISDTWLFSLSNHLSRPTRFVLSSPVTTPYVRIPGVDDNDNGYNRPIFKKQDKHDKDGVYTSNPLQGPDDPFALPYDDVDPLSRSVYHSRHRLACFGTDLVIGDRCNEEIDDDDDNDDDNDDNEERKYTSSARAMHFREDQEEYRQGIFYWRGGEGQFILAGAQQFKVQEIEVYKCQLESTMSSQETNA